MEAREDPCAMLHRQRPLLYGRVLRWVGSQNGEVSREMLAGRTRTTSRPLGRLVPAKPQVLGRNGS